MFPIQLPHLMDDIGALSSPSNKGKIPSEVVCSSSPPARPVSPLPMDPALERLPPLRYLNAQQSFLLKVKVCMLFLAKLEENDKRLRSQVKFLVNYCTAQNRQGNPAYRPLQPVLSRKLQDLLGPLHWHKIHLLLLTYCEKRRLVLPDEACV